LALLDKTGKIENQTGTLLIPTNSKTRQTVPVVAKIRQPPIPVSQSQSLMIQKKTSGKIRRQAGLLVTRTALNILKPSTNYWRAHA